ncbi:hypothetical protein [Desulfosporosinus lacus]|uniref:ABC-2 family transporter protein n=1 Tax=Desulfosporosinus lacus DSM 15449 TaxID=1121420 RepID=A0A1M5S7A2_9FIRM|nr:hypothetical protein [Desulfosporosinus lacus]SHH34359.1 hypothetical protein SAMN02746098_00766 [Desulfosporosinus lacus DSM 15449]
MKKFFSNARVDLRRAFSSFEFLLSVAGMCTVLFLSVSSQLRAMVNGLMQSDVLNLYNLAHFQGFSLLSAIFATLPYSTSFCIDWNNQFIRSVVIRTNIRTYGISKALTCALAGGSAVALGEVLFILLLCLCFPLVGPEGNLNNSMLSGGNLIAFFSFQILVKFFAATFFSVLALWISTYLTNVFVTLAVPILSFYFLITIPPVIGISMRWFYNALMGSAYANNPYGSLLYSIVVCSLLSILMGILVVGQIRRRLEHG